MDGLMNDTGSVVSQEKTSKDSEFFGDIRDFHSHTPLIFGMARTTSASFCPLYSKAHHAPNQQLAALQYKYLTVFPKSLAQTQPL